MSLLALGLNHKTAPLEIRERVAFAPDTLQQALNSLKQVQGVREAAIVSTCNRTELYCCLNGDSSQAVINWFHQYHNIDAEQITSYLFQHQDREAIRHLLRVSSGLDSLVLGEPQILGQIKTAYQSASQFGSLNQQLNKLFQHAFSVAKQVRTDTAIGSSPVSVAFAAVSLAKQIFGDLKPLSALMIGAGETIELAVRHLHANNIGHITIANRTVKRARNLADEFDGANAISLNDIPNVLPQADILISSTASPLPILGKGAVEHALKVRKHRPMFMVDIAVPRDIESQVSELDDVYLYSVDDLEEVIEENLQSRREAAAQAEEMIEVHVERFMAWLRSLDAVDTIKSYRQQAQKTQQEVLDQAQKRLAQGRPATEVLDYLAHTLTNKLLHTPSEQLREAGQNGQRELIIAARELFNLNDLKQ
ncbi:MAG: glutamyl-tRNA reductase [Gammaproteobacteria bacterium]|nr:glutamyl-tRNA reductase [Gammaproteobacteria bacterium]